MRGLIDKLKRNLADFGYKQVYAVYVYVRNL